MVYTRIFRRFKGQHGSPNIKLPAVNIIGRVSLSPCCYLDLFVPNSKRQAVWTSVTLEAPYPKGAKVVLVHVDILSLTQLNATTVVFNPLNPLKHHFTSLQTYLVFQQISALEWKFPWDWFTNIWQFSSIFKPHFKSTTSRELRQQFAACSGLRWQR